MIIKNTYVIEDDINLEMDGFMNRKQITLQEKWEYDIQSYKKSGGMRVTVLQCSKCEHWIKTDLFNCLKYTKGDKPVSVVNSKKECPFFKSKINISIDSVDDFQSKVKGGILGAIVGDALGVPVEFTDRKERKKDPVREMRAYGIYNQPFETWSDDSSMMLCLIDSLTEGYSADKLADKFVAFAKNAYLTPYDEVFDIGNAVMNAVENIPIRVRIISTKNIHI